jgi:hypothetical protein
MKKKSRRTHGQRLAVRVECRAAGTHYGSKLSIGRAPLSNTPNEKM